MTTWTVRVSGLTCHGCVNTVTEQLTEEAGIDEVEVDLAVDGVSTLTLHAAETVADDVLQKALSDGGAFVLQS